MKVDIEILEFISFTDVCRVICHFVSDRDGLTPPVFHLLARNWRESTM